MRIRSLKAFTLGFAASTLLTTSIGFAAKAYAAPEGSESMSQEQVNYAEQYGQYICGVIIGNPTNSGVYRSLQMVVNDGWTGYQAGEIVGYAVFNSCPGEIPVVRRFVDSVTAGTVA